MSKVRELAEKIHRHCEAASGLIQRLKAEILEPGATSVVRAFVAIATYLFVFNNFIIYLEAKHRLLKSVWIVQMTKFVVWNAPDYQPEYQIEHFASNSENSIVSHLDYMNR